MAGDQESITVNVQVDITAEALQTIVENSKSLAGRNEKGHYRVDTADMVGFMISRFLAENNFESFTKDINNYPVPDAT